MYLFTIFVDNEYTAKMMLDAAEKLKFLMLYQWINDVDKMVIACDYHTLT